MSELHFLRPGVRFPIERVLFRQGCYAFARQPQIKQLVVPSNATADVLGLFVSAVKGEAVELTNENIEGPSALCSEFSVRSFSQRVQAFEDVPSDRLAGLEDRFARLEVEVSALRPAGEVKTAPALTQLKSDVARFKADFSPLQAATVPAHSTAPAAESIPSSDRLSRPNPLRPLSVLVPRHTFLHRHRPHPLLLFLDFHRAQ
jgi:hypothetical protein